MYYTNENLNMMCYFYSGYVFNFSVISFLSKLFIFSINIVRLNHNVIIYIFFYFFSINFIFSRGCLHDVMVKAMDCGIVVNEFMLQSRY